MVKLTDVAKLAGVSPTTVSRVINNYGSLSTKTKQKVQQAMRDLNYQPNTLARSLQGKQTHLIGLIFPGVSHPFFGQMVEEFESQLFKKGYRTILCNAGKDKEKERHYLRMLAANQVDGVIAGAHNLDIAEYQQLDLPIISFDRYLADRIPIVSSDNLAGGQAAAALLVRTGSKKVGVITSHSSAKSPTSQREIGYCQIMRAAGITPKTYALPFEMSPLLKALRIQQLLQQDQLEALFCTDDLTALMVLETAQQLGIAVPQQLQLIGYDGTRLVQDYHHQLTTVKQPIEAMVALMIDLLLQRIADPSCRLEEHYVLPVELKIGQTTH